MMTIVPAQKIGNLYYSYISQYQDKLLDYYIEAVDKKGNVTRSQIQQVYVGTGKYKNDNGTIVEDENGDIEGTYPFLEHKTTDPDDSDNDDFNVDEEVDDEDNEVPDESEGSDEDLDLDS